MRQRGNRFRQSLGYQAHTLWSHNGKLSCFHRRLDMPVAQHGAPGKVRFTTDDVVLICHYATLKAIKNTLRFVAILPAPKINSRDSRYWRSQDRAYASERFVLA